MKKIWIVLLIFLLVGCTKKEETEYYRLVDELNAVNNSSLNIPFDINISLDKITDDELVYNVVIDNPKKDLTNVRALVTHDYLLDEAYPNIGIFDNRVNLIPNKIDENDNYVKGIALVGYIPFTESVNEYHGTFRVLVDYTVDNTNKRIYYIYTI